MTRPRHAVWDWNGTLFDDFEITARIALDSLSGLGAAHLTPEHVRHHYTRPLDRYFAALLGRDLTAAELAQLGEHYDARYGAVLHDLPLAADAIDALDLIAPAATQSILSMAPHAQLDMLIDHHGIRARFNLVQGHLGHGHPGKAESLAAHCRTLRLDPAESCLIGDTVDDHASAAALGMRAILVTTGMQSRARLERTGAPVADSLREAAEMFLAL